MVHAREFVDAMRQIEDDYRGQQPTAHAGGVAATASPGASVRQPDAPHVLADVAMRLATFNINGRSPGENRVDPDRLANSIRTLAPDILALQEVDLYQPRARDADFAAIVAKPWSASTTDSSRPSPARQAHDGSRQATGHQSRARRSETPYSPATPSAAGKCCGCLGPARTSPSRFSAPDALPSSARNPEWR